MKNVTQKTIPTFKATWTEKLDTYGYLNEQQEETAFERIHGLPYTYEERMESICLAEEDISLGRVYSTEEIRAMFPKP